MKRPWSYPMRRQRRRFTAGLVLIAYLGAIFGFPAPASQAHASEPYPCQGHLCGCRSADDCWRRCCCHTPNERLQWAQANNVEPPPSIASELGWNSPRVRDQETNHESSCCGHGGDTEPPKSCCTATPTQTGVRLGMSTFRCRGASTVWVSAGIVLPPPAPSHWSLCALQVSSLFQLETTLVGIAVLPPDPPPRLSL